MSYINGYPKKNNEKKDTHLSKHTETKKKHAVKNGVSTPQSTRRGRSVYAAFAQRGGGNAGWAAEKKMRLTWGRCIFVSSPNFLFGWDSFFLNGKFLSIWILHLEPSRFLFWVNMAEPASMFVFGVFFLALGFCGRKTSSTKNIPLKIPVGTTCDGTQR